ncbi:hypothetical protein E6P09_06565 [Haloferax mediterranei ATCC 33500]|uniref:DUF7311 domain-containing protein n=1 Tax=Haloferax mediterranei (strain ATCC 33500 / DSM 1411 / JCM 8866 / NBRC 14739 / NCIMB 2177 / R-4) TaxID=523841 RepID=M0J000_HALMT|nr:hypothetical protein [Haloferax mediterranei]AHZ22182.1 hypothetical protein BM92_05710 [Haloferax mediterranei ATCC 33500]EMA02296.1 hypothetical protein C439_06935 [Haloferax mediterranei ATCC 33500]MDX5988520.1 hypothetical protein [Haloferax mediterranei ATCC 33500]QCQ74936.1 hypothetical protein E6P09_06565 [Haloferax mediterranei ATCC 33500]
MIRVVLTCLLAVAIAGVAFPAADAARADATTVKIGTMADELAHASATLATTEDPTPAGVAGAQRHIVLTVPSGSWRAAGVSRLSIRGGDGVELTATTSSGPTVVRRVGGPRVRVVGERLVLGPGQHRLKLTLASDTDGSVVVIAPAHADSSVA